LRARYHALKESQLKELMDRSRIPESPERPKTYKPPQQLPMPIELAALQNLQPSYFKWLAKLGLEVVIVRFNADKGSPIWLHNPDALATDLENELVLLKAAGEPVSGLYPLGAQWHFYQVKRKKLGEAVRRFKEILAARGLLEISQIFHAESAESLREWFPGTAAQSDAGTALAHAWDGDTLTIKDA
jgi:hypothetical protein